ncbi:MAG: TlpA disulfide reductase family protein, partial [Actinomycetota bacterium]
MFTLLTDVAVHVDGSVDGDQLFFDPVSLETATGWTLKEVGLCRGPVCVPLRGIQVLGPRGVNAQRFAEVLGRRVAVDAERGVVAMAVDPAIRGSALRDKVAPEITLPDLQGTLRSLTEFRGRKTLVVTFATWCGCRYDLPGWQALEDELRDRGFSVLAIAFDDTAEEVRPFTDDIRFPVLLDRHHVVSEAYAMSNVPTVVWIDEAGRVVLPNSEAFGTDLFADFTGVKSGPHLDAVRAWVSEGILP